MHHDLDPLEPAAWQARRAAHERRALDLTEAHRNRSVERRPHPVEDFLFTYYSHRPARLRQWHPGVGVALRDAPDFVGRRFYRHVADHVVLDEQQLLSARRSTVDFVAALLPAVRDRPAGLGCFGLHEWAMVYRTDAVRHQNWPLRLGAAGTDEVVRSHHIRCSHYDAFRFFTPQAKPLNTVQPSRETQLALDQPGCLHVGMDLYKWAYKLSPATPGELVLDCFELARDIRTVDMQASPYDLTELGYRPIRIEEAEGKAEYVRLQREFADRGGLLRERLIAVCDRLLSGADRSPSSAARS